uniref:Si:ch1073-126c3.2 n=2 Tax=Cyprinus carpio TaxID=7962 RepID=A0A8C1Z5X8_CYPCA
MKFSTMSRTWKQLCLLFAFLLTTAHGNNNYSCSSSECTYNQTDKQLQDMKICLENKSRTWTEYQKANIFIQLQTLTDIIQKQQNKEFQTSLPKKCPVPDVTENGGLLCLSARKEAYCKPMCNAGYDFNFLRRSRLFEECSSATQDKWTTQFIGGNRLAICDKSDIAVSGAPSAYFPKGQDCQKIKSDEELMGNITKIFQSELVKAGITQSLRFFSLLCG